MWAHRSSVHIQPLFHWTLPSVPELSLWTVPYAQDPAVLAGEGHGLQPAYWAPIVKHSGILPDPC